MDAKQIIQALVDAMKKSVAVGCTDHLNCADDAGEFWYGALEDAEKFLNSN